MAKIKTVIIGSGNIRTDMMIEIMRLRHHDFQFGNAPSSRLNATSLSEPGGAHAGKRCGNRSSETNR
ncbi:MULTISPECIES: hypothetical protein [unclassified Sphingobium]|uniref:hypothetical protein n=1 Tax=unclassified Sphingobium TaxID=2611147 RepID=UPI000A4E1CED|nr:MULTISPECIES: hypothetical protein [Sphingomonadaceae]NML89110.1 hypothetical protein [Sphingobium sp. TB-6]